METTKQNLTIDQTMVVYNGRPGCMCGCRGNYHVHPLHLQAANKDRGYDYETSDMNLNQVKRVVNILQQSADTRFDEKANCYYADIDGQTYAAYLVK